MKPTLNLIVQDILTTLKQVHDDREITSRMVEYWVQSSRAVWLTNELNKFKPISPEFIQDLGVIPLEVVDQTLYNLTTGYQLLKTTQPLPVFLEAGNEPAITRVGPAMVNGAYYKLIPYERLRYIGTGRFNTGTIYAFLKDRYIYLATRSDTFQYVAMRRINVRGILADPTDAARFTDGNGNPCYSSTSEYPIGQRLVTYMKDIIIQSQGKIMLSLVSDKFNNATDDSTVPREEARQQQ